MLVCMCRDVGRVREGLGEKLGLLLQWLATLVAGVIVSLVTEWRLTLLMGFAGLLIAGSTALLSVVCSTVGSLPIYGNKACSLGGDCLSSEDSCM